MKEIEAKKVQYFTKVIGSVALSKPVVSRMGFAKIIDKLVPSDEQQKVSHGQVVEILVSNRLTSPSPLYGVEGWAADIDSKKLYGIAAEELNDDRIGRTLDALAPEIMVLKGAIATDISRRFQIGIENIHWDLTSFHFRGAYNNQTEGYIKISYTKSRPFETAFKAVKVGLNIANDGKGPVPIFYDSLDGNGDPFEATIKNMENLKEHLKVDRIIRINDKGCFSTKVVVETVRQGFDVIGSMKLTLQYVKLLEEAWQRGEDFTPIDYLSQNQARKKDPSEQDKYYGVEVKSSLTYGQKEYPMRFIFIRSDGKVKRDKNRRERHIARIKAEVDLLKEKAGKPYCRDPQKLQTKIDTIIKRYAEGKFLKIELQTSEEKVVSLDYNWDEAAILEAARWDGIYLLGTTLMEGPMGEVFRLFKEQHYSESANKDLKGPLRIRPIFLQNQARIESLIFILFLALMVYMLIERWYRNSVDEPKPCKTTTRTLLKVFRNYALTVMVSRDEVQEIPNSLDMTQHAVFSVLGLQFSDIYHGFT